MSSDRVHIDICIATYKRPHLLAELLESLICQRVASDISLSIVIVDNDAAGSAQAVVESFQKKLLLPIIYDIEPVQNIALTRNRTVSYAHGDFIAFIDDDERADVEWIQTLYENLLFYDAAAVFGPVVPILPDSAPDWVNRGHFFDGPRFKAGTSIATGRTGNAMVRAEYAKRFTPVFNPEFGQTGGEDVNFFDKIISLGGKLVWCDSAIVYETVHADRLNVVYLAKRAFRGGQTYASMMLKRYGILKKIAWFFYRVGLLIIAAIAFLVAWPFRRHWGVKALQKVCSNLGQLSTLTPYRYRGYVPK